MVGITRPLTPVGANRQAAVASAVDRVEETTHPLTGIVAEPEAKQVILDMLHSGTPEPVIRSIFDTGYYEIIAPFKPSGAPYIAITYTNDDKEGYISNLNSHPTQDFNFLTTPKLGMAADGRDEWEEDGWDELHWGSIEYCQESGKVDTIPWPVLYTIDEVEDSEPVSGLQIYFTGCDDDPLDLYTPTMDGDIEPWRLSKSKSESRSPQIDLWVRDWSEDYELGDIQNLVVTDESVDLEQDSSVSSNSGSELDDLEMSWTEGTGTELGELCIEFEGEEVGVRQDS
ncbi:hypothetical protein OPQ81_001236 [Rhizoctonia solani]|nr:hypothetical protein OPQ81_001236 [Rhizoctonia solani]